MSFIAVGIGAATSIIGGVVKHKAAKKEEDRAKKQAKRAKEELNRQMQAYKALDTSNPYLNMENTMEDLTVNQKQAEFQAQQFSQSQANIMEGLRGAAGSSGIAALAQSLAGQGQLASQKAAASIGMQETSNQRAERAMAGQIQSMERKGDILSREMQGDKTSTLLGMAQQRSASAQQRVGDARAAKTGAIAGMVQGLGGAAMGAVQAGAFGGGTGGVTPKANTVPEDMVIPQGGGGRFLEAPMSQNTQLDTQLPLNIGGGTGLTGSATADFSQNPQFQFPAYTYPTINQD
tara:strand:+ start:1992 stop:2864 length:873 start_codon:yes stop_codon:yes gene_type:complete